MFLTANKRQIFCLNSPKIRNIFTKTEDFVTSSFEEFKKLLELRKGFRQDIMKIIFVGPRRPDYPKVPLNRLPASASINDRQLRYAVSREHPRMRSV